MTLLIRTLLLLALLLPGLIAPPFALADAALRAARTIALLDALDAADLEGVRRDLAPAVAEAGAADQLVGVWAGLPEQVGALQERGEPRHETRGDHQAVVVPLRFERMSLDAVAFFDAEDRIGGFRLLPASPPPAAAELRPGESEISLGSDGTRLTGVLSLPAGEERVPAAVLVHGSGPQDRDQTLGPNKPFAELAEALSARGVAVLRYDKRPYAHPDRFAGREFTVEEEVVEDALLAIALLREHPRVDPARIQLIGHSLGGTLAPRIAAQAPDLDGLVLMAATARPLQDLLMGQIRYLASADGEISEPEQAVLDDMQARLANLERLRAGQTPDAPLPLDLPAAYWRDLAGYDPVAAARAVPQRLLILQGGRDYQATEAEDFVRWTDAFEGEERARLVLMEPLNHLFHYGEGPSTPLEYFQPHRIPDPVFDTIAEWIHGRL